MAYGRVWVLIEAGSTENEREIENCMFSQSMGHMMRYGVLQSRLYITCCKHWSCLPGQWPEVRQQAQKGSYVAECAQSKLTPL